MPTQNSPYVLLLDTNAWVTERMLLSSVGSAALYALAADGAHIVLPEIVEMEVGLVLTKQANKAAEDLRKNADFLRQISGHEKQLHPVPTSKAIHDGIARRWKELDGLIVRAPFTLEQARSALGRVLDHSSPSGENNEQFRDCCIWESVLDACKSKNVHLVTNDSAFYQKGARPHMAPTLKSELEGLGRVVKLHSSVGDFLNAVSHGAIDTLEKDVICDAIVGAVTPLADEIAAERIRSDRPSAYELGDAKKLIIKGYATPKPSLIAVTFEVSFDLRLFDEKGPGERQTDTTLRLDGSCSYHPGTHQTSDVVVKAWNHSLKGSGTHYYSSGSLGPMLRDQLSQTRYV